MRCLVTGGAGYIGANFVKLALDSGHRCHVYDNLCSGHRPAVDSRADFTKGDILDTDLITSVIGKFKPDVVVHFAALALVAESVEYPERYDLNNRGGTASIAAALKKHGGCTPIIFSSTCAIYGEPDELPVTERAKCAPLSPYGLSKLAAEKVLEQYAAETGAEVLALRYFNAAGASLDGSLGEDHQPETHLIPSVLKAIAAGQSCRIYGSDFSTSDGTCERDYIHVLDLAIAHLKGANYLLEQKAQANRTVQKLNVENSSKEASEDSRPGSLTILNLGSGISISVMSLVKAAADIVGTEASVVMGPRRFGDPGALRADISKATELLGWQPEHSDISTILKTAHDFYRKFPNGYQDS